MKKSTSLVTILLFTAAVFALLSGCAPVKETRYVTLQDDLYANVNFDKGGMVIQYTPNEPEIALEEELEELDKVGEWAESPVKEPVDIAPPEDEITYDFPITLNKQVEFYLDLFQHKQRKYFERWLARSTMYIPYIHEKLREKGLPLDLAYLAMIESGYNPLAYSRSHAVGLWQFISSTGKNYGLRIDSWVDERRDPEKATRAALDYLSYLHEEFDSWYLAVAGYNAGEGKIGRGIKKYKTTDFWKLASYKYLKLETKRYVPKLIAAILIAKEPEKYGFTNIDYMNPLEYDRIEVPPMTDLHAVAAASNQDIKAIRKLNNELLKNYTPPGNEPFALKIPKGSHDRVAANLSRLHPVATIDFKTHVVSRGETLTGICRHYNINKTTILKANNLHSANLQIGQRLRIPYQTTKYVLLKEGETPTSRFAKAGQGGKLYIHQVKKGETLSRIARQYNVTPDIIVQWNNLESIHKIAEGQNLALYLDRGDRPVTLAAGEDTGAQVTYYQVKKGDTLWNIARRFDVSPRQIKQWNNLRSNLIHPGKRLVVNKV
jgi:membrane-bound lytic murein transglycosylase D